MKRIACFVAASVLGLGLVACASSETETLSQDGDGSDTPTQVGPISFDLPEGFEEVFLEADVTNGWVGEYANDTESPDAFVGVWRFEDPPSRAIDAAGQMMTLIRAAETHPGLQTSEAGSTDIAGAEDAYVIDLSSDADTAGRWWVVVDADNDIAAGVEFYGEDLTEDDLHAFADSLTFNAEQGW